MKIKNPEEIIKTIQQKFDKNDYFIIIYTLVIGLINNFYFILGDGVAPDAVSPAFFNIAGNWEISLGRFEIQYVNMFRYGLVAKLIIILISIILIAFSIILIKKMFKIDNRILLIIIASLICIAPQFTETYMYIYCADAYLLAFFLSILSVYCLNKTNKSKLYYIPSIISVVLVCSLYQAYLGVIIGLTILLITKYVLDNEDIKKIIQKFVIFMIAILLGIIIYYCLLKLILYVKELSLASYKGANGLGINTIKMLPFSIVQCYKDFYYFFFTDHIINNAYWDREKIYLILLILLIVGGVYIIVKSKLNKKNIRILLIVFLSIIFPIGISIMNIIAAGTKINLVTGPGLIVCSIIIALIYNNLPNDNTPNLTKWGIVILSFALIWTFLLENTFTYIAREQTYINYKTVTTDIYTKATLLENYSKDKEWMFSDIIKFYVRDSERSNGFITYDNVTWNNYNGLAQNRGFFEKYIGIKINICSKEKYETIKKTKEFEQMAIYPNKGSIKIINDVIVVKVSENTY